MKKIIDYTKYLILPLLVVVVGCSFENQVLLTIDSDKYTIADFRENFPFAPTDDSLKRLEKIDEFINQKLVVKEARERGYEEDPVVMAAFENHRKEVIYRGYYEEKVIDKVKIPDSEIRKVYNQFIDQYHLAQIVVDEESLAQHIHAELKKGVPFDSLLKFSLDTLTENGDIGSFSVKSLPPEIVTQIEKTKEGGTTDAIQFGNYFYILKVIEHKKVDTPKFEDVKENIRDNLMREKILEQGEKFIQEILEKAKIEYSEEGLDALLKPDSLITEEDLNKWVVKKYDTSYVRVRTIRQAVLYQYRQSFIEPKILIERVLIPDIIYDKAEREHFDKKVKIKRRLSNALSLLLYQKFYSDEVLGKVAVDSMEIVTYYGGHKNEYKDKKFSDVYSILRSKVREEKIQTLRKNIFEGLREKYNPEINQAVLERLLKEEK